MKKPADTPFCLAISSVVFCGVAITFGQDLTPTPATTGQAGVTIEEVIVTGSNIPTAEEVGPHPVDTYRRVDILRLGARTATDFTQILPSATGAALNENNVAHGDGRTEINLRGILAKETLVLQDGRRLAPVGFAGDTVDLNTLPLGLIDHIDILKDGASAIYGADAVAAVVNIWLIHKFRGLEIYGTYGNSNLGSANDMAEERAYLLAGSGDDKTDIVIYAESYNRAAIYSRDVDLSSDADYRVWGGSDLRSGNFAGRVADRVYQPTLNGGVLTPTPHAFPNALRDPQYVARLSLPREEQLFNFADITPAIGPVDRQYFYGSVDRKICDHYLEIFADFKYVRTFWEGDLAPAPLTPDVFTDANHPFGISAFGISVPIQNAFNPFTVPDYISAGGFDPNVPASQSSAAPPGTQFTNDVRYSVLEAGPRSVKITTDNFEFTGGLKGDLDEFGDYFKGWEWQSGFRYNEDDRSQRIGGIINNDALRAALLDPNPATAFNPFGINVNTQAALNRVLTTTHHFGRTSLTLEDLSLHGDLFNFWAGPVSFAIGGEHRTEHAADIPDSLTASGQATGATNFAATSGSRDVWSVYWELLLPVTSPTRNVPGFYSLELGYQERYEYFSDFGPAERPKVFLRWQPIDSALTMRATYSEAFHAPTLSDLFRGALQSSASVKDPRSPRPDTVQEFRSLPSGNPSLEPETAYEWTYGAVFTPAKWWQALQGLTLTADFYHLDVRAVTVQLDPQFLVNHETEFPGQVIRGPSTGPGDPFGPIVLLRLPEQNLGRIIEEGWDYEAVYSFDTSRLGHGDWGRLALTVNGNYLDRVVIQAVAGGPRREVVGKFGAGFLGTSGGGSFTHNRGYASLFYNGRAGSWLGGFDTGFTMPYVAQYWDSSDRKVREWVTLNWILNYTFSLPARVTQNEVAGFAKDGGSSGNTKDTKNNGLLPVSTAAYAPCGWRAWLNNTTITVGLNNIMDKAPPFVAGATENGYDEATTNIKGRTWYVALTKRF